MKKNINKNSIIGVMDSGVGGLTVLKQLKQLCPNESYLYFGDTKNLPYGEKTKSELITLSKKVFDFYEAHNAKAVVMACNTTSATVYDDLKDKYSFKMYPLIQVVSKALTQRNYRRIAVMATKATVESGKYKQEIQKHNPTIEVFEQACPLWVPLVEKKIDNYDEKEIITGYLNNVLEFKPDIVVLGCTHYPYLLDNLAEYAPRDLFLNPASIFAEYIKNDLAKNNMLSGASSGSVEYFASANPVEFKENARLFMEIEKQPEVVCL